MIVKRGSGEGKVEGMGGSGFVVVIAMWWFWVADCLLWLIVCVDRWWGESERESVCIFFMHVFVLKFFFVEFKSTSNIIGFSNVKKVNGIIFLIFQFELGFYNSKSNYLCINFELFSYSHQIMRRLINPSILSYAVEGRDNII